MNPAETPHLTIRTMADYLIAPGAHQRFTVLQNMRNALGRQRFAPYYQVARQAIRAHHQGDTHALSRALSRLARQRHEATKPTEIAKIDNNLRVLNDYRENFGDVELSHEGGQFAPLFVNSVRISVEPTLSGNLVTGKRSIVANVIVDTQADSPIDQEIDYVLELLHHGSGVTRRATAAGSQYWHPSSGNAWYLNRPSTRRWRDIEQAATEIALRWPTIGR